MREQKETPSYEARHHSPKFLKTAARMASKKTGKRKKSRTKGR